ncbi:MAG: hypothetical protein WCW35_11015 [Bacteroidota bacterium]|jgi:ABC-type transport system involved in multi-copper enzyme maturation permease subunit
MRNYAILFPAEFKRFWTIGMIIFAVVMIGLGLIPSVVMMQSGMVKTLSALVSSADQIVSFFTFIVFSAGIVGADIKSGWIRTLLIRSVTRQQYIVTKIAVVFAAQVVVFVLTVTIALVIVAFDPAVIVKFDLSASSIAMALKSAQILLMIVISAYVSCIVQGAFNSLFVYGCMVLSQMMDFLVMRKYWDIHWAVVLKDYIFPTGFEDAQHALAANMAFPLTEMMWGIAALFLFFAAALFAMNKVVVDSGSE